MQARFGLRPMRNQGKSRSIRVLMLRSRPSFAPIIAREHLMANVFVLVLACARLGHVLGAAAGSEADSPAFMMASGIAAPSEMCMTVENGASHLSAEAGAMFNDACAGDVDAEGTEVVLEPCAAAIAAGDGRELWKLMANGQLSNVAGKKCVGLRDNSVEDGGSLVLMSCDEAASAADGRSEWEMQGTGERTTKQSRSSFAAPC